MSNEAASVSVHSSFVIRHFAGGKPGRMKILVISMAGIGDTLLATPLIRELRANFPDAVIDALAMWPGSKDLLENNPHVNRVFQKNLIKCGKFEAVRFLWSLRRERYQLSR